MMELNGLQCDESSYLNGDCNNSYFYDTYGGQTPTMYYDMDSKKSYSYESPDHSGYSSDEPHVPEWANPVDEVSSHLDETHILGDSRDAVTTQYIDTSYSTQPFTAVQQDMADYSMYSFDQDDKFDSLVRPNTNSNLPSFNTLLGTKMQDNVQMIDQRQSDEEGAETDSDKRDDSEEETEPKRKTKRKRRINKRARGHLWEFVLELLADPGKYGDIVQWEDKKKGIFRFLKSADAAKLWGDRKGNEKMTYEKMSRAMRYSRKVGNFKDLPIGYDSKRLCFMFGEEAYGWEKVADKHAK